jgi:uncharacterized membrane protein YbhN (UPF0104 family)
MYSSRRNSIALAIMLLAFGIFLPRLSSFNESVSTLRDADYVYVVIGLLIWLTTFFSAAFVYKLIALRPLAYGNTLLVQLASGFTNRLAPLGAGILALNISYLIKRGHTGGQAGAIVALNNLLGFLSTVLLLLCLFIFDPHTFDRLFNGKVQLSAGWLAVILVMIALSVYLLTVYGSKLVSRAKIAIKSVLRSALDKPLSIGMAFVASIMITLGYSVTLYVIGLACNAHFSVGQAIVITTIGVVAASLTPTPGGVGGAEVGLVVALIATGITSHQALTVALLYRFLIFWLPILPGFVCLQVVLRKRYI